MDKKDQNVVKRFTTEGTNTYPDLRIDPQILNEIQNDNMGTIME